MTSTEDQARAAMRAIAGTVDDAPPLRLAGAAAGDQGIAALLDKAAYDLAARDEADLDRVAPGETGRNEVLSGGRGARRPIAGRPGPRRPGRAPGSRRPGGAPPLGGPGRDRRRRRWSVLAPVAAAVMIVVVAVALAVIRDIPNGSSATPPTPASSASHASGPADARAGAPEYYVALMQRDSPPYLVVGNTFTGQVIATVKAPAGVFLDYVFGAAGDDREFIVTGETLPGPVVEARWYRLRITPDGSTHALLTPLPDLTRDPPAGAALSPDGTELAVAPQGHPATLRVYSTATGALLREWSTKAPGELMAERIPAGALSSPYAPLVLRWSADGRQLAFAWNATSIRVLDAAAPNGDLIAGSRPLGAIGTSYATLSSYTCHAGQGWQFVTVTRGPAAGQGIVCAGSTQAGRYTACTSPTGTTCAYTQRVSLGFLLATGSGQGGGYLGLLAGSDCTGEQQAGAYIGWANADGSVIIGSQVCGGQRRFGVFRGGTFTPLPALPDSTYLDAGALGGTFAW